MSSAGWFYASNNTQLGPVSGEDLVRLAESGFVTADTLVWREGMAGWEPYSRVSATVAPAAPPAAGPEAPKTSGTVCAQCGKTVDPGLVIELGGRTICAECKPRVVQMLQEGVAATTPEAERIRREHLNHEASIKSWGSLQILGGVLLGLSSLVSMVAGLDGSPEGRAASFLFGAIMVAFGCLLVWLGRGLHKLRSGARTGAAIMAGIGLIGFPIGTLINGYVLYLLVSKKGRTIFTDHYRQIVAETPHIKYRTPIYAWIVMILLVLGLVALIVGVTRR